MDMINLLASPQSRLQFCLQSDLNIVRIFPFFARLELRNTKSPLRELTKAEDQHKEYAK